MELPSLEAEIRSDNKKVTYWLLFYEDRKKDYMLRRDYAVINCSTACVSDSLTSPEMPDISEEEKWIELIEEVERRLSWKMKIFLCLRREYRDMTGRKGWTAAAQWKYAQKVADYLGKEPEDVYVDRFTFNNWWSRIVEYTARLAAKRGLLS